MNTEVKGWATCLDIVDLDILDATTWSVVLGVGAVLVELEAAVSVALLAVGVGLVDLGGLWELAVGLEGASLVGGVLEDDVSLLVLVVAEGQQNDITLVNPDLLTELATDVSEALGAVEAESLEAAVTQHLQDLSILCDGVLVAMCSSTVEEYERTLTLLLEGELALLVVVLVLSTTTVLASL